MHNQKGRRDIRLADRSKDKEQHVSFMREMHILISYNCINKLGSNFRYREILKARTTSTSSLQKKITFAKENSRPKANRRKTTPNWATVST